MKAMFDLAKASKWLSTQPGLIRGNKGNWIAVGARNDSFAILGRDKSLDKLVKALGPERMRGVLVSRVPDKLDAVCIY